MQQYLDLLSTLVRQADRENPKDERTGTGTYSIFGHQMKFNLNHGFPLLTTKKLHTKSIVHELLWMLSGSTNIEYLNDHDVHIWDEWADDYDDLGPVYGYQWRNWPSVEHGNIDQIAEVVEQIKTNPSSRRLIVSAWNVEDIEHMALPPCHTMFQFNVKSKRLSCHLYQRSADVFLGLPFNIASYALLTHLVAEQTQLVPGDFIWSGGDVHLYANHLEQAKTQLQRHTMQLPSIKVKKGIKNIFSYKYSDINFQNYETHPHIKARVSI